MLQTKGGWLGSGDIWPGVGMLAIFYNMYFQLIFYHSYHSFCLLLIIHPPSLLISQECLTSRIWFETPGFTVISLFIDIFLYPHRLTTPTIDYIFRIPKSSSTGKH
jgi:hypothetical protein